MPRCTSCRIPIGNPAYIRYSDEAIGIRGDSYNHAELCLNCLSSYAWCESCGVWHGNNWEGVHTPVIPCDNCGYSFVATTTTTICPRCRGGHSTPTHIPTHQPCSHCEQSTLISSLVSTRVGQVCPTCYSATAECVVCHSTIHTIDAIPLSCGKYKCVTCRDCMLSCTNTLTCTFCGERALQCRARVYSTGQIACRACQASLYRCESCNGLHLNRDMSSIQFLCTTCYTAGRFTTCDDCGREIVRRHDGTNLCEDCWESSHRTCVECGRTMEADEDYQQDICPRCARRYLIHSHDYKPRANFHGRDSTHKFYGIEAEVSHSYAADLVEEVESALGITPDTRGQYLYYKEDGSITGVEFVSHPATWGWLKDNAETWNRLLSCCKSHDGSNKGCGLHVHISKRSFTTLHLYKFLRIIYESPGAMLQISGRSEDSFYQWCNLRSDKHALYKKAKDKRDSNHYEGVNLVAMPTVEIRVFRGTLSPTRFWSCLEFIESLWQYTHDCTIPQATLGKYVLWVDSHLKEYPKVKGLLNKINKSILGRSH